MTEFKVDDQIEVETSTTPISWFPARVVSLNADGKVEKYTLESDVTNEITSPGDQHIRKLSDLNVNDVIVFCDNHKKGYITNIDTSSGTPIFEIKLSDDGTEIPDLNRSQLAKVDVASDGDGDKGSGSLPSTTPLVPASSATLSLTEKDIATLGEDIDYKMYRIAEKVVLSDNPITEIRLELNKLNVPLKIGDKLEKHITDKSLDKTSTTKYPKAAILTSITAVINQVTEPRELLRFVTDYKTAEQELLAYPNLSSYLIFQDIGVHSSDAFVKAVCDRMQGRLSGPIKDILRKKRKELYETSFDETPKAIPSVARLEAFFDAQPDQATILLFITMMQSMLTIEPLLNAHYKSFGRALQKTFKTPGLYFNKSAFTKDKSGSKTVKDLVNKERTKTAVTNLLERLNNGKIKPAEQFEIVKQINLNIDEYKRILGEGDKTYQMAKTATDDFLKTPTGKLKINSSYWNRFKRRLNTFLGYSGGKKTKHHSANQKTRRPQHVMRRKTHHKKRRPMLTRRQLQVRR